jgi:predicted trehalose synthase
MPESTLASRLDNEWLTQWIREQRWFAAKSQTLTGLEIAEEAAIDESLSLAICQVLLSSGAHELYQLAVAERDGEVVMGTLVESGRALVLLDAIETGREVHGVHGCFCFRHVGDDPAPGHAGQIAVDAVRAIGGEQSNSSIVFDNRFILKLFRRLESGINPELELLRFLTAHGYPHIASLHGWYEYEGEPLAATLGILQEFVTDGVDGWQLALDEIPHAPATFLARLASLGIATAQLHSVLASDASDPAFSPEEPSNESTSLLTATLDDEIERMFGRMPDDPELMEIADLAQQVREHLQAMPSFSAGGRNIRLHGDFHLGQTISTDHGWTLLDFEGEPARSLTARRAKRSPLRDIASMLRSFSYATWAVKLQRGLEPPEGFEEQARQAFLDAYLHEVEPTLLPSGQAQIENQLAIFELEKALYELRYELDNRPDWVAIPVAGIRRIVESE